MAENGEAVEAEGSSELTLGADNQTPTPANRPAKLFHRDHRTSSRFHKCLTGRLHKERSTRSRAAALGTRANIGILYPGPRDTSRSPLRARNPRTKAAVNPSITSARDTPDHRHNANDDHAECTSGNARHQRS